MPPLPLDLQDVIDQIDRADRAADTLASSVTDAQFHWQPNGGRGWSIAQCLEHLSKINELYGNAVRTGVTLASERGWCRQDPLRLGVFGRLFVNGQEPPVKRRFRAPGNVQPASSSPRDEVLRSYHDAHAKFRTLVADCAEIDVNRATFKNPFVSALRVRVGTGLRVIPAHDRRHLWQAEQVKGATGFPR